MSLDATIVNLAGSIDLHSHTNESDGTFTPSELVQLASQLQLDALAITDHDTFLGYELAIPFAREANLDLVCGIELSTKANWSDDSQSQVVHLLAYFLNGGPSQSFRGWLEGLQQRRRERNERLLASLQRQGVEISLGEVEAVGRSLTGRPHFARILIRKGYAANQEEAFERYLGEAAPSYVEYEVPFTEEAIGQVLMGGGIPVVAHPIRLMLRDSERERIFLTRLRDAGLAGLEVFHSDQDAHWQAHYARLADELELLATGGSDFHGALKPRIQLGTGAEKNVRVPRSVLDRLREQR